MNRTVSTLAYLALLIVRPAPPAAFADSWTSFRGPNGTGEALSSLPPGSGPLAFDLRWRRPLGSGYSGVSVGGDTLVTATADNDRDLVMAIDGATGEELWRYDLAPSHKGHDGSHDGPISTPAVADGRVFALGPAGHLAAIDLTSGKELWSLHLVEDLGCERPFYDFGSSPLVVDDIMVLQIGGEEGSVAGFDVQTGEVLWRAVKDQITTQSPILTELAGKPQILVLGVQYVAGLDPASGEVLWQVEHGGGPGISFFTSPVPLAGDRLLVQNARDSSTMIQVTREDTQWLPTMLETSRGLSKSYSPPARAGEYLYGYTARFLSAIDPSTGELLWRSRQPGDGFLATIEDQLVVLTKKGSLHLGPASPAGWQESLRLDLFEDLAWTPPSIAGSAIYLRSLGEVARVDLVRTPELVAQTADEEIPSALRTLAEQVRGATDSDEVIDRFLADRELPLISDRAVVFLWRGEARDLAIAGDMIGMRREEPMQRLADTDLWWWATEMDPRAPAKYLFYVDYAPTTDPSHDRVTQSTILGPDMNWRRQEGVEMSWFAMPEWPGWKLIESSSAGASQPAGTLEFFDIALQPPAAEDGEDPEPVAASVPVWLPAGYGETEDRYPVLFVFNSTAREIGNWPRELNRVSGKSAAPMIVVFLELEGVRDQHVILVDQLVPAIDERYRTIADREHRGLIGMGWPGFGAGLTALENPEIFGLLGVQSFFALDEQLEMVRNAIAEIDNESLPMKIYLEWGRWDLISPHEEMNFRASSRAVWDLLSASGWHLMGGEVWDSTDWASWGHRTGVLLETLFPLPGVESDLANWRTSTP